MKKYSIMVEGKNILIKRDHIERMGFLTTRWISAPNIQEAKRIAIEHVKKELDSLDILLNTLDDIPLFSVEEIREVNSFGDNLVPGSGFTFYEEE